MCHEADQSAFLHTLLYFSTSLDHIYLETFLGTNSLFVLMCRKEVNHQPSSHLKGCIHGKQAADWVELVSWWSRFMTSVPDCDIFCSSRIHTGRGYYTLLLRPSFWMVSVMVRADDCDWTLLGWGLVNFAWGWRSGVKVKG